MEVKIISDYRIWKSIDEVYYFLAQIRDDIYSMPASQESNMIQSIYQQLSDGFDESAIGAFVKFINQVASNLYLRKT